MSWNYAKLRGRIKEYGYTQKTLANTININSSTLSEKLNNKYEFTVDEINAICKCLKIPKVEIGEYFFAQKVQKN